MAKNLSDLARISAKFPAELRKAQQQGVRKASLAVTKEIRQETRSATGGDMRLSGVGKRGARIGARYDVKGTTNPVGMIRATGPYQLIERDTKSHDITPKKRRRGKQKAMKLANGTFAAKVHHPGTRGKRPWSRGLRRAMPHTKDIFAAEVHKAVVKAVKG